MAEVQAKYNAQEAPQQGAAVDIREVLARATKFWQRYAELSKQAESFFSDLRGLRSDVVQLLNAQENMGRLVKEAEIRLAKTEREAQTRLSGMEMGHRALIERITKKEVDLDNRTSEAAKRENAVVAERHKYELLKEEYERKLSNLSKVEPAIYKK